MQREPGGGIGNKVSDAVCRMLGNENLDQKAIPLTHREQTARCMVQATETILLVPRTTILNYNTDKKTHGIGYISDKTLGVNIHTCLAVIVGGLVLRVLNQQPCPEG